MLLSTKHNPGPADYKPYAARRTSPNIESVCFGSSNERNISYMARELNSPFVDKTSNETPSVGIYNLAAK